MARVSMHLVAILYLSMVSIIVLNEGRGVRMGRSKPLLFALKNRLQSSPFVAVESSFFIAVRNVHPL